MNEKKLPTEQELLDEVMDYVIKLPRKKIVKIGGKVREYLEWCDDLPMKPEGWDDMSPDERLGISCCVLDRLHQLVGEKATLHSWYVDVRGHSKKEFRRFLKHDVFHSKKHGRICADFWLIYLMGILTGINVVAIIVGLIRIFTLLATR